MVYLMLGLIGIGIIIFVIGIINEIENNRKCCGNCKLKYDCWFHIDGFTYEYPACKRFVKDDWDKE